MGINDPRIEDYISKHTTAVSEILQKLERDTFADVLYPNMLSGSVQGMFLQMISNITSPSQILEIGTYTGYSAICLCSGLKNDGMVHTIEISPELESMALSYFEMAGVKDKIMLYIGNALQIIKTIEGPFDIVFIDADKENYLNYYKLVIDKVKDGGIILADNALWSGKVTDVKNNNDKETLGIAGFNDFIQHDDRVENILLPLRDGIMMIRKIPNPITP